MRSRSSSAGTSLRSHADNPYTLHPRRWAPASVVFASWTPADGVGQPRAAEVRFVEIGSAEICAFQMRLREISPRENGLVKARPSQIDARQSRLTQVRVAEIAALEFGRGEVCSLRVRERRSDERILAPPRVPDGDALVQNG